MSLCGEPDSVPWLRLELILPEATARPWCVYKSITDTEKLPCHPGHARDVCLAMARPRPRPRTDWVVLGVEDSESCIRSVRPTISHTQPTPSCPRARSRIRNLLCVVPGCANALRRPLCQDMRM